MKEDSCIYIILCWVTGKRYIGCAINYENRLRVHRCNLKKGNHHSPYLQHSWNKYGADNHLMFRLEKCNREDLHWKELFWIRLLGPEFNMNLYPKSQDGYIRTPEQRMKMRLAQQKASKTRPAWNKGKTGIYSKETIEKIRRAAINQKRPELSAEDRKRIGKFLASKRPKIFSMESRMKMRLSHLGKKYAPRKAREISITN